MTVELQKVGDVIFANEPLPGFVPFRFSYISSDGRSGGATTIYCGSHKDFEKLSAQWNRNGKGNWTYEEVKP